MNNFTCDFTIDGEFADGYSVNNTFVADPGEEGISDNFRLNDDGYLGKKIMIWKNVSGDSLTITINDATSYRMINAMKIDSTPEPGSMIMSLFLFIMYLRKKQH